MLKSSSTGTARFDHLTNAGACVMLVPAMNKILKSFISVTMNFAINDQNEIYFNLEVASDTYVQLLSDTLLQYTGRVVFEDESWGLSIFTKDFEQFCDPWDSRYVVALPEYEIQLHPGTWEYPQLVNTLIARLNELTKTPVEASILGLWVEQGIAYIDFCQTFASQEAALAYAKAGKQLAIYDRFRQETIEVE